MQSWNVRFMVGTDAVAGIYQRDDVLNIADVAREIELCLNFNPPDAESWQPALLLRDPTTGPSQRLVVLDQQDQTPFPTPRSKDAQQYDFVFHRRAQCAGGSTHSLRGRAASPTSLPPRTTDRLQTHAFAALTYRHNATTHDTSRSARSLQTLESRPSHYAGSLAQSGAIALLRPCRCRTRPVRRPGGPLLETMRYRRLLYLSKRRVPV